MDVKNIPFSSILSVILSATISAVSYAQDFSAQSLSAAISDQDIVLGNKNSPVTVIEYGDYQCPYCVEVSSDIEPRLRNEYINSGKVKLIYRNQQFLGDESIYAAAAAACANDQNKFWAYHDALYRAKKMDFKNGGGENDDFFNHDLFIKLAKETNLDLSAFTACLDNKKYVDKVKQDSDTANLMGVNRTPMIYVNNESVPDPTSYASVKSVINKKLVNK